MSTKGEKGSGDGRLLNSTLSLLTDLHIRLRVEYTQVMSEICKQD